MDKASSENDKLEIDYLHPDGKPVTSDKKDAELSELDAKPTSRQLDKALEEADGHYMPKPDATLDH